MVRGDTALCFSGRAHERWGEAVVAIVSLTDGSTKPDTGDIRSFLERRLAGYKCPKDVIVVEEVKRSPAGKQDYSWAQALAEQAPPT
ncbi:MAG: hypothetical protein R3E02_12775 [Blastomonas sp.]